MSEYIDELGGTLHPDARPIVSDGKETVTRACDGDVEPLPTIETLAHERAAQSIRRIFEIVRGRSQLVPGCEQFFGRRFLCLIWVIDPSLLSGDGTALSLRAFAKLMGHTAPNFSPETAEFSRLLGITNGFQSHGWNRKHVEQSTEPTETGEDGTETNNEGELDEAT